MIAATPGIQPGDLAGEYAGAGAEATAGVGIGANVLIGGTGKAFSLQPISVEGEVGLKPLGPAGSGGSATIIAARTGCEACGVVAAL